MSEQQPDVDRPEPDQAIVGSAARTPDHEPADGDDREVALDDPEQHDPVIDDEDREG
jgi:hypothetical protein